MSEKSKMIIRYLCRANWDNNSILISARYHKDLFEIEGQSESSVLETIIREREDYVNESLWSV